jgi:hypothetical protein
VKGYLFVFFLELMKVNNTGSKKSNYLNRSLLSFAFLFASLFGGCVEEKTKQGNISYNFNYQVRAYAPLVPPADSVRSCLNGKSSSLENKTNSQEDKLYDAPYFEGLPAYYCARYAVLAAKKLTNSQYCSANAWDFAKRNKLIDKINGNLEDHLGLLIPGTTIIGYYNPGSKYNSPEREVTHVAVYLGRDKNREIYLAEEAGSIQRKISGSEIERKGFIPRQIIGPR